MYVYWAWTDWISVCHEYALVFGLSSLVVFAAFVILAVVAFRLRFVLPKEASLCSLRVSRWSRVCSSVSFTDDYRRSWLCLPARCRRCSSVSRRFSLLPKLPFSMFVALLFAIMQVSQVCDVCRRKQGWFNLRISFSSYISAKFIHRKE